MKAPQDVYDTKLEFKERNGKKDISREVETFLPYEHSTFCSSQEEQANVG